jgi:hypothetical protein
VAIVPAVGLGLLFVFFVGVAVTYFTLGLISSKKSGNTILYRDTLKKTNTNFLTEGAIEKLSYVGGGLAVLLLIFIIINVPREWTVIIWYGLTGIGILVGISTFFIFGSNSNSRTKAKDKATYAQIKHEQPKYQAEQQDKIKETRRNEQELERERRRRRAEYETSLHETQRKQAELLAIKDDLFSIFRMTEDQSQERGKSLAGILNHFFRAYDIPVREAFEFIDQTNRELTEYLNGVIEIDGELFLVEMKWRNDPVGMPEVSQHLVRLFNLGHAGLILISNSKFTLPAVITCKDALSQKIVVLCELEEIVTLLGRDSSLKDFLRAKIVAARKGRKPLIFPLSPHDQI